MSSKSPPLGSFSVTSKAKCGSRRAVRGTCSTALKTRQLPPGFKTRWASPYIRVLEDP